MRLTWNEPKVIVGTITPVISLDRIFVSKSLRTCDKPHSLTFICPSVANLIKALR